MTNASHASVRYDRLMNWVLPAIVALTPLIIVYALVVPNVGQSYFFKLTVLASMAGLGLAWAAGWRPLPRRLTACAWLFLLNGAVLAVSIALSPQWLFSLKQAMLLVCGGLFYALLVLSPDRSRLLARIHIMLAIMAVALSIYGILQHFGIEFLPYSGEIKKNKVIATIGHPNHLASVLGPCVFIIMSLALGWRGFGRKVAGLAAILVVLVCIALARTRSVWLGLAVGLLGMLVIGLRYGLARRGGLRTVGGVALGSVAVAAALVGAIQFVLPAMKAGIDLRERIASEQEIKSRLYYWKTAIDLGKEGGLFGQGYAMFDAMFWDQTLRHMQSPEGVYYYDILPTITGSSPEHVHNEYLEIFCEEGLAGITAFVALLFFFLLFGYRAIVVNPQPRRALRDLSLYCGLLVMLVDAILSFPWRLPVSMMIMAVLLATVHGMIYPQQSLEPVQQAD